MSVDTQTCNKCKANLPITQFALDRHRTNGRQNTCKACVNSNRKPKAQTKKADLKKIIKKDDLEALNEALSTIEFNRKRICALAAEQNAIEIFKAYLPECGSVTVALDKATYYEHKDVEKQKSIVNLLLDQGPNLEAHGGCFSDPLYLILAWQHPDIAKLIENLKMEPSIHFLAATLQSKKLEKLLKKDPTQSNALLENGLTPIYCATRSRLGELGPSQLKKQLETLQCLMDHGAELSHPIVPLGKDIKFAHHANTPLAWAKSPEVARFLLERQCPMGNALFRNAYNKKFEVAEVILEYGGKLEGSQVLHEAANKGILDVVKWCIEQGADVNEKQKDGSTPLHRAAARNSGTATIKYLLGAGANPKAKDQSKRTPLDYAIANKKDKSISLLKEYC